jgi:ABC-type nitrate/sulfonate/bicarbonate transport system substrate-binding protein
MNDFSPARLSRRHLLALGGAALAAPLVARRASAQALATVRVAYIPFEASAQLFYASELGLWEKAGLNVELTPNPFGAAIAAAVVSGAVDIGYATVMTLASAHAKHLPFTIVAPANAFSVNQPLTGALMSASPDVKTGKDLNGKTIGSPGLNTLGEYGVRAWVDATGGDASTLHFVEIPFSEMPAALETKRIDAAYVAEPFYETAKKTSHQVAMEFDAIAKEFLVAGWFTTTDWANAHAPAVAKFADVIRESTDWAQKNPAACIDIIVKYLKVDRSVVASSPRAYFARTLSPALVQPGIDLTAHYAKFPTFPAGDLTFSPTKIS